MPRAMMLAASAWADLQKDVRTHSVVETGGLLVGRAEKGVFLVPFVVPAGDRADRSYAGFAPDSTHQQVVLDFLWDRFAVDYVGDWHRHPGSFDRPSAHDFRTARTIVESPEWDLREALFPIATVHKMKVRLRAFLMRRSGMAFEEIPVCVVRDDHRMFRPILAGRYRAGGVSA